MTTREALCALLRTCVVTFLLTVLVMLALYSVWVLASVYGAPSDLHIQNCSQVPVEMIEDLC